MRHKRPQKPGSTTPKKHAHSFTTRQVGLLIALMGFTLITLVGGIGLVVSQERYWGSSAVILTPLQHNSTLISSTIMVYQMPPTWTSSASDSMQTPTYVFEPDEVRRLSLLPTATTTHTSTPAVSLTPVPEHWKIIIGYTVENRLIEVFRFGVGKNERMIVAGIHGGNEWNTIALADELIEYLISHPEAIPEDATLYILRSLNPDGEAAGHVAKGRLNANGVDLNRNFEINWKSNWKTAGCWNDLPVSAGSAPGSEPETQALMTFLRSHRVEALISYHSAGLGIFPSGDPPDEESKRLARDISIVSGYRFPPVETGCEYSGSLVDWAQEQGIVAVDIELPDHLHTDFPRNLNILELLLRW